MSTTLLLDGPAELTEKPAFGRDKVAKAKSDTMSGELSRLGILIMLFRFCKLKKDRDVTSVYVSINYKQRAVEYRIVFCIDKKLDRTV